VVVQQRGGHLGEPVDEQGNEVDHSGTGQLVDRLVDVALDGLQREDAAELLAQPLDRAGEGGPAERVHGLVAERHRAASLRVGAARGRLGSGGGVDGAAAGHPGRCLAGQGVQVAGEGEQGVGA
jgi:hypothetical protein